LDGITLLKSFIAYINRPELLRVDTIGSISTENAVSLQVLIVDPRPLIGPAKGEDTGVWVPVDGLNVASLYTLYNAVLSKYCG